MPGAALRLPAGWVEWRPSAEKLDLAGLLVVRGFLTRGLVVDDRRAAEPIGAGDLIRPWVPDELGSISTETRWHVLEPATLAVLDQGFLACAGRWPAIIDAMLERIASRSHPLLLRLAAAQSPQVARRLYTLVWHLADRWGRRTPDGVVVSLKLSRVTLAELVSSSRESVSRALGELAGLDLAHSRRGGFLLPGQSPAEMLAGIDLVDNRVRGDRQRSPGLA